MGEWRRSEGVTCELHGDGELMVDIAVTYNGSTITSLSQVASCEVKYGSTSLFTLSAAGTKTLTCNGKYMTSNVTVGSKTLTCSGKVAVSNIVVTATAAKKYLIQNGNVQSGYTFTSTTTSTGTIEGVNIPFTMRGFDANSVSSNYRRLRENVTGYANREGAYYLNANISFANWSKLRCTFYASHNSTDGTGRYCRLYIYKNTATYLDSGTKGTNFQYVQAGTSSSTKDISLTSTLISNCNRISICVATSYADVSGYIKDLWLEG